jgi:hypothetical protein
MKCDSKIRMAWAFCPLLVGVLLLFPAGADEEPTLSAQPRARTLLLPAVSEALQLADPQRRQIESIIDEARAEYNKTLRQHAGDPQLQARLQGVIAAALEKGLGTLDQRQRKIWDALPRSGDGPASVQKGSPPSRDDEMASRSLIIPTIEQLRNPPSPSAYGPSTSLTELNTHAVAGNGYLILTDHTGEAELQALRRLAAHRDGVVVEHPSLAGLTVPTALTKLQAQLRKLNPRFVAVAPCPASYRENTHLAIVKLLAGLDDDPQLDAFPGYLVAGDAASLSALVDRTIAYQSLSRDVLRPVSMGAIEDDNSLRYRSYQKAMVVKKHFADVGVESPSVIITTRQSHAKRKDFPARNTPDDVVTMTTQLPRETFGELSDGARELLADNNLLFIFGHGTPGRICGAQVDAYADVDFNNEIIFCGSCMSASPLISDRADLSKNTKQVRFATVAIDNGAVMMLGHMGLCGGFPKVFPFAEKVLQGQSAGEAYQQLMNALIGDKPLPNFYSQPASRASDPANGLLYILLGDPALVPVQG